ncbi:MAG TPA: hypothetical protein VHH36_05870 [Candidatus Thermoplasmatota archaeon]|nr:hypothetical protein [Candidatus Thermoplasmatota archaeon]
MTQAGDRRSVASEVGYLLALSFGGSMLLILAGLLAFHAFGNDQPWQASIVVLGGIAAVSFAVAWVLRGRARGRFGRRRAALLDAAEGAAALALAATAPVRFATEEGVLDGRGAALGYAASALLGALLGLRVRHASALLDRRPLPRGARVLVHVVARVALLSFFLQALAYGSALRPRLLARGAGIGEVVLVTLIIWLAAEAGFAALRRR